jgi:6-pyruvoyltetrahydropterin/6-carboxytetrahydropterin synthase
MLWTISKSFDFDAAHWLPLVADTHKCRRMHGHTYKVEVICSGEPDDTGMLLDYADIAKAWKPLHALLDHHILNEIPYLENPTTEVLAARIFDVLSKSLPALTAIRVYESSTTWCEVRE